MTGSQTEQEAPGFVQVALNTADMVGSLRLYSDVLGFSNGGGKVAWGDMLQIQDLGPAAECMIWWLVGASPFFQLELFHHSKPGQRPLPHDWRPCDHGWVRFGVAVADFDAVVGGLDALSVPVLGTAGTQPDRRLAFRDPHAGVIVEVRERVGEPGPTVVYATSSVADLTEAKTWYREVLAQGEIQPLDRLHSLEDEKLWGLPQARRDGFLVKLPGGYLEIVHYSDPAGKPQPADRRICDQGIMNIGIGAHDSQPIREMIARVCARGLRTTSIVDTGPLCATYVIEPGFELELLSFPKHLDAVLGFERDRPFRAALDADQDPPTSGQGG